MYIYIYLSLCVCVRACVHVSVRSWMRCVFARYVMVYFEWHKNIHKQWQTYFIFFIFYILISSKICFGKVVIHISLNKIMVFVWTNWPVVMLYGQTWLLIWLLYWRVREFGHYFIFKYLFREFNTWKTKRKCNGNIGNALEKWRLNQRYILCLFSVDVVRD